MAGKRVSMRKIREVLRLTHELGLSVREVRGATGVGKTAVSEYVRPEPFPVVQAIADVFGDRRLGGGARELLLKPGFKRQHQRPALFLPHRAAIAGAAAPDRLLDRIEGRDALESLAGDRRVAPRFVQPSSQHRALQVI